MDLFWGLRGGAASLGVVTNFAYQLHPLREVLAGLVVHPAERAVEALRAFRDFAADAPDEFCGLAVVANAPPLPFLDAVWHGRPVVIFALCWSGAMNEGARALAALRRHGVPLADHIGPMPYATWQTMQDPAAPAGLHYYWKTANYATLTDEILRRIAAAAGDLPSPRSEIHIQHMGGAVARASSEDSAFPHRNVQFFVNLIGITNEAAGIDALRDRIRALHDRVSLGALPGTMANFSDQEDAGDAGWSGSETAARLAALRRRYDPAGILMRY
jgi:FAD/FMN-containing dehydrogenase